MEQNLTNKKGFQLTAFDLRLIAIISMVCDHAAKSLNFSYYDIFFLIIGRLAFPLFAFQLVQGYTHTRNFKKYCKRLLIFAIISEIPYNIFVGGGSLINPFYQNVLWTMLIGLLMLKSIDKMIDLGKNKIITILGVIGIIIIGYLAGDIIRADYFGAGVLLFAIFYFSKKVKYEFVIQILGMVLINFMLLPSGNYYSDIGIIRFPLKLQPFAMISLIPIWFYKGKQGYHSKWWNELCYCFYPVHMIILIFLSILG